MKLENLEKSCESTPFLVMETPDGCINLYWTKKPGVYGNQVVGAFFNYPNNPVIIKSTGCGYSKTDHILDSLFSKIGKMPKGSGEGKSHYQYHIGGNFYKVEADNWVEYA